MYIKLVMYINGSAQVTSYSVALLARHLLEVITCVKICQTTIIIFTECIGIRCVTQSIIPRLASTPFTDTRYEIIANATAATSTVNTVALKMTTALSKHSRQVKSRLGTWFLLQTEQSANKRLGTKEEGSVILYATIRRYV